MSMSNLGKPGQPAPTGTCPDMRGSWRPAEGRGLGTALIIPSINVLGAYFPDWLFCIVGALVLTILVHLAVSPTRWYQTMGRLCRLSLVASASLILALLGWVIFFQR